MPKLTVINICTGKERRERECERRSEAALAEPSGESRESGGLGWLLVGCGLWIALRCVAFKGGNVLEQKSSACTI